MIQGYNKQYRQKRRCTVMCRVSLVCALCLPCVLLMQFLLVCVLCRPVCWTSLHPLDFIYWLKIIDLSEKESTHVLKIKNALLHVYPLGCHFKMNTLTVVMWLPGTVSTSRVLLCCEYDIQSLGIQYTPVSTG